MKHEIKMIQYNFNILIIALYKTIDIANDTFEEDSWVWPQRPGGGGGCLRKAIHTKVSQIYGQTLFRKKFLKFNQV